MKGESHMEQRAIKLLSAHGCKLIEMLSECRVRWENKAGIIRDDDIATLSCMTEDAWNFWANN